MFLWLFNVCAGLTAVKVCDALEAREMLKSVFLMLVNVCGGLYARYVQNLMFVCLSNVCDGLGALEIERSI